MILDYCHNVDGMRRLAEFVGLMMDGRNGSGRQGRAIGVIGIPGDRRDEDHLEYGRLAAHAFDEIIVREDRNRRGRKPGESAELVKQGVEKGMAEQGGRCDDGQDRARRAGSGVDGDGRRQHAATS